MKNIIIREYLESLTESDELDYIFTILLEVMDFKIISTPKNTKGLAQYGKDIIAIGTDQADGIRKRFYFEVKGGADKDVSTHTFTKTDGVRESIIEAKDRVYKDASNPGFNDLPVKIVLVHNGEMKANVKETFDGFIEQMFPTTLPAKKSWFSFGKTKQSIAAYSFERWEIHTLTKLFSEFLFNEYLLTNEAAVNQFKKVLVLNNTAGNNFHDFYKLVDMIFEKAAAGSMGERKKLLLFETLKMVSFIVYHYSRDVQNLNAAKKCIPYLLLRLWSWILDNGLEKDPKILQQFDKTFKVYYQVLEEYFVKTLPVSALKDGLWSPVGGRYEKVGYPMRAMEYMSFLVYYFTCQQKIEAETLDLEKDQLNHLIKVLNQNDATARPLFDNHSIPVCLTINFLVKLDRKDDARNYVRKVVDSLQLGFYTHKRLPDASNRIDNIIRFVVNGEKSVYYEDSTSHLFTILLEYMAVLDMGKDYLAFTKFIGETSVDLAMFYPYDDTQLPQLITGNVLSHEQHLLSHELYEEGYQSITKPDAVFADFEKRVKAEPLLAYPYKTSTAGMDHLLMLAHIFFKTPLVPDAWRVL